VVSKQQNSLMSLSLPWTLSLTTRREFCGVQESFVFLCFRFCLPKLPDVFFIPTAFGTANGEFVRWLPDWMAHPFPDLCPGSLSNSPLEIISLWDFRMASLLWLREHILHLSLGAAEDWSPPPPMRWCKPIHSKCNVSCSNCWSCHKKYLHFVLLSPPTQPSHRNLSKAKLQIQFSKTCRALFYRRKLPISDFRLQ